MSNSYNVSGNVMKALERACYMAEDMRTPCLETAEVLLSLLADQDTYLNQTFIEEEGSIINATGMVYKLSSDPDIYEQVFKEKYPSDEPDMQETADKNNAEKEEKANDNKEEASQEAKENEENSSSVKYVIINTASLISDMGSYNNIEYSENLTLAFENAQKRCESGHQDYIDENNLLYSILCLEDSSAKRILELFEIETEELKSKLEFGSAIFEVAEEGKIKIPKSLQTSCEILNDRYYKGQRCDILCRDNEIFKAWNIFSKKTKRNAILVGAAGVGKTAIVEAMTAQIVNGKCPKEFKDYKIVSLELNSMVAGTKYRGEFEKKVENFINFIKMNKNLIVFVDEIHTIIGAGNVEGGGGNMSESLKPLLSRDDVIFIGSTTDIEYERYFKRDSAFARRFEKIEVKEPKLDEVKKMVSLRVDNLSKHHNVEISDELLNYIIITAKAMNCEAKNPDLTVDLIDRSMAIAKMRKSKALAKKDIDKVFSHNYETFKKMSKNNKRSTAYHEAGHALMKLLAKYDKREDVKIISIIPADYYVGVTISESNESFAPVTRNAVLESASMSIAGRVAQEFVEKDWDFGACSDLTKATTIIRRMIVEMGMDSNIYTNISLYNYQDGGHTMSPQAVDQVNKRIEELMKEVYEQTKALLTKHKRKLDIIAELLINKGIISIEEVYKEFNKEGIKISK